MLTGLCQPRFNKQILILTAPSAFFDLDSIAHAPAIADHVKETTQTKVKTFGCLLSLHHLPESS